MISKILLLTIIGYAVAKGKEDIKVFTVDENGEKVFQIVRFNKEEGTEEYQTPKHADRDAVDRMDFTALGIFAQKQYGTNGDKNLCLIGTLDEVEDVAKDEEDVDKADGKFPDDDVKTTHKLCLLTPAGHVDARVRSFCLQGERGMTIVNCHDEKEKVKDMEDINKDALEIAKEAKRSARKRALVREFIACTNASTNKIMTCPGDKLRAECKIRRPSCTYKITCPMNLDEGGFKCKGLHKLNSIVCCDYNC